MRAFTRSIALVLLAVALSQSRKMPTQEEIEMVVSKPAAVASPATAQLCSFYMHCQTLFPQKSMYECPLPTLGADRRDPEPNCPPHPYPVPLPDPLPPVMQTAISRLENQLKATVDPNLVVRVYSNTVWHNIVCTARRLFVYFTNLCLIIFVSMLFVACSIGQFGVHGIRALDQRIWSKEQDWTI